MLTKAKRRLSKAVDAKAAELAEDLQYYDGEELEKKQTQLEQLVKIQGMLKQPKISKEVLVELLKLLGVLGALGIAIYYDSTGHILPKSVDKWIPGPKL